MDTELLIKACRLYHTSPDQLTLLSGGHYNAVYRFPLVRSSKPGVARSRSKYGVFRIGVEDCPPEQTLEMLEWVQFLSENQAPVAAPIRSNSGKLLERLEEGGKAYTITAFEEAQGTLAERIPPDDWTDELFFSIGRATGKLHAVSKRYKASQSVLTRPPWFESYEIQEATNRLNINQDPVGKILAEMIAELRGLPTDPACFGLIHDDLHFANFLVQPSGKVTIIDFDDCVYGWYAMDVAMALFDVLVLYGAKGEGEKQGFAGYRMEVALPAFWLKKIPNFIKLKEICVYVPLIGHADIDAPGTWVGDFMAERAERIANNVPYVTIDFGSL
jgi:Ser/Thr protein kinase RdoA (MazF antagonist)